jgi:hypothetical protein
LPLGGLIQLFKSHYKQGSRTPQQGGAQHKHDIHGSSPIKSMGEAYFSGRKNGEESGDGSVKTP